VGSRCLGFTDGIYGWSGVDLRRGLTAADVRQSAYRRRIRAGGKLPIGADGAVPAINGVLVVDETGGFAASQQQRPDACEGDPDMTLILQRRNPLPEFSANFCLLKNQASRLRFSMWTFVLTDGGLYFLNTDGHEHAREVDGFRSSGEIIKHTALGSHGD
jgi:hypothetical protein